MWWFKILLLPLTLLGCAAVYCTLARVQSWQSATSAATSEESGKRRRLERIVARLRTDNALLEEETASLHAQLAKLPQSVALGWVRCVNEGASPLASCARSAPRSAGDRAGELRRAARLRGGLRVPAWRIVARPCQGSVGAPPLGTWCGSRPLRH